MADVEVIDEIQKSTCQQKFVYDHINTPVSRIV
jgi:hypothetical protein